MKVDPELTRQLDQAKGTDSHVEAVLRLSPEKGESVVPPAEAQRMADGAMARVAEQTGVEPSAVNVLANLGVVVVAAQEKFVRGLIDQPEFESAVANEAAES